MATDPNLERRAVSDLAALAAAIMQRTLDRRVRRDYPADAIVAPSLIGRSTRGRHGRAGLDEAVEAVHRLWRVEGCTLERAALAIARQMRNWWMRHARRSDDVDRLGADPTCRQCPMELTVRAARDEHQQKTGVQLGLREYYNQYPFRKNAYQRDLLVQRFSNWLF